MKQATGIFLALILAVTMFSFAKAQDANPQPGNCTEKALLFSFNGLSTLSSDAYKGGIGARYATGGGWWLRGSLGYHSNEEESHLSVTGGVFKDLFTTGNTALSVGGEIGTTDKSGDYLFGIGGSILWIPLENIGLSFDDMLSFHKTDQTWKTVSGGTITLNVFF